MKDRSGQLRGARGARRTLEALSAQAARGASLVHAAPAFAELAAPAPAELTVARAPGTAALGAMLDALEAPVAAPVASRAVERRAPSRPIAPAPRPGARALRSAPPPVASVEEAQAGALALAAAQVRAGLAAPAAASSSSSWPSAPPRGARRAPPIAAASIDALIDRALDAPGTGALRDAARAGARSPIAIAARPIAAATIASPPRAASPPPASPRLDRTTPAALDAAVAHADRHGPPAATASRPRGLAGLASWWRDQEQTRAGGAAVPLDDADARALASDRDAPPSISAASPFTPPLASIREPGLGLAAPVPAAALVAGAPRRAALDGPSVSALDSLDDVTRALERVLVRELRRHGVTTEDP